MVEVALVLPILIVLAVSIADFGRIFAVSIIVESAARNGAELAANTYLTEYPGKDATPPVSLADPAPGGSSAYYGPLHDKVAEAVCDETQELGDSNYDPGTGLCTGMPLVMVCIHDSQDTDCGGETMGASIPSGCSEMATPPSNAHGGSGTPRWAEVRVCYRFQTIMQVPGTPFGEFWIQRTRTFTIPCYFALGNAQECG